MNPLNPTKTKTIEKNWFKEIRRKYSSLQKDIDEKLRELSGPISTNVTLGMDSSQQRAFIAWLEQRILEVTGQEPPLNWQGAYQVQSYTRAIERVRAHLISQGADIEFTEQEKAISQGLSFYAAPTLGSQLVSPVVHQDALEFLFTRAYESLKGWNEKFVRDVRQLTFDAVKGGTGIRELSDRIKERTKVTASRAELIARTETISAYRESSINETQRASEEIGEEINMRWITAIDSRVRHLHAAFHGTISTPEETRRKGNISPYNCRCSQVPVIKGANDTPEKNAKFSEQRRKLIELEEIKK